MKVVAGKYKRKNLFSLEGNDTRPTKDMVKEAIFDTIQIDEGDSFLDLFSGSGAIGIEAISRGAINVIFNDANIKAVNIIKSNLKQIGENSIVYNLDAFDLIDILKDSFDYIFIDPPYVFDRYDELVDKIIERNLLKENGVIIIETEKNKDIKHIPFKEKRYGICKVLYFKYN